MIKEQISNGFRRSLSSYPDQATIQKQVSEKLGQLIGKCLVESPNHILEIGCGTGFLTSALLNEFPYANWTVNDLNSDVKAHIDTVFSLKSERTPRYVFGDAETMDWTQNYNLIASSSCFQWFNAPETFFRNASECMTDGGFLAFSTFGPQNMQEIKSLSGQGLNYFSREDYFAMLSGRFEVISSSEEILEMYFDTPCEVLKHIKATGVNGSFRQHWTKARLAEFTKGYSKLHDEWGFPLTYHPIYFICKKR